MGTFASVSLYDRGSTRPVSGRTVRVTSWPDGGPVETDPAVLTTDYYGATPEFSTVDPDVHLVRITAGTAQPRVLVSIEKQAAAEPELPATADDGQVLTWDASSGAWEARSGTSGAVTSVNGVEPDESGNVTVNAALPDGGIEGQVLTITASGAAWAEGTPGPQGPEGPQGPQGDVPLVESSTQPAQTNILWVDSDAEAVAGGAGGALSGEGPPEGVVAADIGIEYIDTLATAGAVRWVKTTADGGTTGWMPAYANSGFRALQGADMLDPNVVKTDWGGTITLHRVGSTVQLSVSYVYHLGTSYSGPLTTRIGILPMGFRCGDSALGMGADPSYSFAVVGKNLEFNWHEASTVPVEFEITGGSVTYTTEDPWPTTLPGSAS